MKNAARNTVLGAIRQHLSAARRAEAMPPDRDALPDGPRSASIDGIDARVTAFVERLGAVGGRAWRVSGADGAAAAVGEILAEHGARRVAFSDAALCAAVRDALGFAVEPVDPADRVALFAADAGVTSAQLGVAETGSLILRSDVERHRLASLVPPLHIALLPTAHLLDTMAAALAAVRTDGPAPTITIVTGPSRTADIELILVVGVHGPRHLHVVLIDGE